MSIKNSSKTVKENGIYIHPTARIEEAVIIGDHSQIWDHVHIRKNTRIGHDVIVGEKSTIAYDVTIGNFVKINAMVYICTGVKIEDQCMISAGTVFTNDRFPRAMNRELTSLEVSEPTHETLYTIVRQGVTIGANATIGPGIEIKCYAMVGMGSVVTADIPAQALVHGNPAKLTGYVCLCGPKIVDVKSPPKKEEIIACKRCNRRYIWLENGPKLI